MSKDDHISYNKKKGENNILWLKRALWILVLDPAIFKRGHSYKFSKDSNVWIWYYPDPYPPWKTILTSQAVKPRPKVTSPAAKQIDSLYLNSIYKTGTSLYVTHFNRFKFIFRIYIYFKQKVKQFKTKKSADSPIRQRKESVN